MSGRRRLVVHLALVATVLAGCAEAPTDETSPAASEPASPTTAPTVEQAPDLVVVGHATRPQLHLTIAQARRLTSGRLTRWRGMQVVADLPPRRAVAAVERDPGTLAVVPLAAVGPTVVAARVDGVDPVRERRDAVELTVVGDLMLTRGVTDPVVALAPMAALLRRADLAVGNLESTLSTRGVPTQGSDSFGASPALVGVLRSAGFEALSLANNHAGDFGDDALLDTVGALRRSAIRPFGAGRDLEAAARPAIVERGGVRFGFLGFNAIGETPRAGEGAPGALSVRMPPRTGPLVRADLDRVLDAVRRTAREVDVVVVLPHWGTQYTHVPEPVQREVGRALVGAGADLVVGGHPHWVQGIDVVRRVPVLHSLGNFVFDMDFMAQTMQGVVLEATFWGARLRAIRLVPYAMDPQTFAPNRVGGRAAAQILDDVWSSSTGPFAR
jgi:poly-gamma-glutamate synthesis protein (capsule biosynthesis protein)